ncbi:MAG: hypothetical protein WD939_03855 [Dehalococcoidia bacterium]
MTKITIYPISGRQIGPLSIPHRFCEECDLTIHAVRRVVDDLDRDDIEVEIKPWIRHMFDALRRGGWHAPVVTIDGKVYSQGVVPDPHALAQRLRAAVPQG